MVNHRGQCHPSVPKWTNVSCTCFGCNGTCNGENISVTFVLMFCWLNSFTAFMPSGVITTLITILLPQVTYSLAQLTFLQRFHKVSTEIGPSIIDDFLDGLFMIAAGFLMSVGLVVTSTKPILLAF